MDKDIVLDTAVTSKRTADTSVSLHNPETAVQRLREKEAHDAYGRGRKIAVRNVKDKKLRTKLKSLEEKYKDAALKAKDAEVLLENEAGYLEQEGELEKTYRVRQDELRKNVAVETAQKSFELKLEDFGPYVADYTRNGRGLLLAGRKGHVSTMDWREGKLGCELQLQETVRDAKWLHNDQYFAVAQKKYVYIYDQAGVELHCLKKHVEVTNMQFLPYHFLLATIVSFYPAPAHIVLTYTGPSGLPALYRHFNRPNGYRDAHQAGHNHCTHPKPLQRCFASRSSKWYRNSLVSQRDHSSC